MSPVRAYPNEAEASLSAALRRTVRATKEVDLANQSVY
jgi:hypothetical protein